MYEWWARNDKGKRLSLNQSIKSSYRYLAWMTVPDINECVEGSHTCVSSPAGNCTNTAGTFICSCGNGYVGDGLNTTNASGCAGELMWLTFNDFVLLEFSFLADAGRMEPCRFTKLWSIVLPSNRRIAWWQMLTYQPLPELWPAQAALLMNNQTSVQHEVVVNNTNVLSSTEACDTFLFSFFIIIIFFFFFFFFVSLRPLKTNAEPCRARNRQMFLEGSELKIAPEFGRQRRTC